MKRPDDDAAATFRPLRPRLVRIAYRMLGSVAEAEDAVQDAYIRWHQTDRDAVRDPAAFLTRTVTRLCLDVLKSARHKRETYVGPWLPEPLLATEDEDVPDEHDLTLTLMLALERLSPLERAAFLLHDIFGVPFEEIAKTLDRDPATCRQLATRARKNVRAERTRFTVPKDEGRRIADAFFAASRSGDTEALQSLLADNVVAYADGGGKMRAALNPIVGLRKVRDMFLAFARKADHKASPLLYRGEIDGLPGFVSVEPDGVLQSTALDIIDGRIIAVYVVRNPDKLRHLVPQEV